MVAIGDVPGVLSCTAPELHPDASGPGQPLVVGEGSDLVAADLLLVHGWPALTSRRVYIS